MHKLQSQLVLRFPFVAHTLDRTAPMCVVLCVGGVHTSAPVSRVPSPSVPCLCAEFVSVNDLDNLGINAQGV